MKIYISHSGNYDYENELYMPLKESALYKEHEIFLPHESQNIDIKTKDTITSFDLMVGEVSYPSTGQGIELGLAAAAGVPIVCLYQDGAQPSSSLRFYSEQVIAYSDAGDFLRQLSAVIEAKQ